MAVVEGFNGSITREEAEAAAKIVGESCLTLGRAAEALNMSRQRIYQLRAKYDDFPKPIGHINGEALYHYKSLYEWDMGRLGPMLRDQEFRAAFKLNTGRYWQKW